MLDNFPLRLAEFCALFACFYVNSKYAHTYRDTSKIQHYAVFTLQIFIEGGIGNGYQGDIAIDDVMLSKGSCRNEGEGNSF